MDNDKVFDVNNLPADFNVSSTQTADFEPIDPGEIYTVEVRKAELRENKFFKPEEKGAKSISSTLSWRS
jgi:hypothetical protein